MINRYPLWRLRYTFVAAVSHQLPQAVQEALGVSIDKAKRLIAQSRSKKAQDKQPKLYSWHAPEVEPISNGKSRNPYEFGVKVGIATTLKGTLILGAIALPGNPYDGHTLNEQVEQATNLMQALGTKPQTAFVDLGYRGLDKATWVSTSSTAASPRA